VATDGKDDPEQNEEQGSETGCQQASATGFLGRLGGKEDRFAFGRWRRWRRGGRILRGFTHTRKILYLRTLKEGARERAFRAVGCGIWAASAWFRLGGSFRNLGRIAEKRTPNVHTTSGLGWDS
jgi:hypothetical protein